MSEPESAPDIRSKLAEREPIDQEEFVRSMADEGFDQNDVLSSLNDLMKRDKVSYTVEWNLQTEKD